MKVQFPRCTPDLVEEAIGRLLEAIAVLETIEAGDMLAEMPRLAVARRRHQRAVSLLAVLRRDLTGLYRDLKAAQQVEDALVRATMPAP